MGHLLSGVDDVIHLTVLLGGASADVGAAVRVGVEAHYVTLMQVGSRFAIHDPLRNSLTDAAGVRYPYGLGGPESANVGRLAEYRESVVGEGEEAVELAGQSHAL